MKKLAISVLSLLAVLATGFLGATHWLQTRIESEIGQALMALRPLLASASHGPVAVNLWDRSVVIPDLVLIPRAATGAAATTVASISATGIFNNAGVLSASRITVKDIQSFGPSLAFPSAMTRTEVPAVTLEGVTLNHAAVTPSHSAARMAASLIGAATAASVSIPRLKSLTVYPSASGDAAARPDAPVFGTLDQEHTDIKVSAVRGGRIGVITTARAAISGTAAGATPAPAAEINNSALSDLDIGIILSLFDAAASRAATPAEPSGLKTVLRHGASGTMNLRLDGTIVATLASAETGTIALAPARIMAAIRTLQAAPPGPGQRATRKQELAVQDAAISLYEAVAADRLQISRLDAAPPGHARVKLDALQMHSVQDGKIAHLSATTVDVASPPHGRITAARIALQGWNLIEMIRLPQRMSSGATGGGTGGGNAGQWPPVVTWPLLLRLLEGIDIEKLTATALPHRPALAVAQLYASRGPVIGQTPTSGQLKARFSIAVSGRETATAAALSQHGLSRADIRFDGGWTWQEATKTMTFGPAEAAIADVGSVTAKLKLTNVSRLALVSRPDLMPAAIQAITLGPVELTLRDDGLVKLLGQDATQRLETFERVQTLVGMIAPPVPPLAAVEAGVARFLALPGSQLTVALTPKGPISFGSLLASGKADEELLHLLASQIDARVTAK